MKPATPPTLLSTGFRFPHAVFHSTLRPMPDSLESDPRFNEFVILQAQNAGLFLGQLPNPHTGGKSINLRAAKSVIDSLEMLASKTRGNLTASEVKLLTTALHNLKPLYQSALASAD